MMNYVANVDVHVSGSEIVNSTLEVKYAADFDRLSGGHD